MKSRLKKYRILLISLLLLALFLGFRCLPNLHIGKTDSGTFSDFCTSFFQDEVTSNTVNLHFTLKDPASAGIRSYDVTLGSISSETPESSAKALDALQDQLSNYSYRSLTGEEQLTFDLLTDYLSRQQALAEFPFYEEVLTPSGGITSQLPILLAEYEFNTKQDVEDYLTLLGEMDAYFAGVLEYEQKKADRGLFMSDRSCMKVIEGCEIFTENPEDNFLVETFANRLDELDGLSDAEKQEYISRNRTVIAESVVPAYQRMITGLTQLLGLGRNEWGVCNYKNGLAYYEAVVAYATGCDDGAESLYQQIEEARKEDLAVCSDLLAQNPKLITASEKLDDTFSDETEMLTALQSAILEDFPEPPETDWEICHVDPALSEYLAPAFYITAPIDDYTYNRIYVNDANAYSDLYYFTTLAHEGYPGHLYQTIQSYNYGCPLVQSLLNYPGYTEGWATYVEMQAYYYAGLDEDLASLLQHNQAATLSLYATSDIGIHYYGWEKDDMIKFWSEYGITDEDTIDRITELVLDEPGNYLKYYVGYLKFRQLREKYEEKLGDSFDAVAFHEAILRVGPAPFALLEEHLDDMLK